MNASHLFAYGKFHCGWFIDEEKLTKNIKKHGIHRTVNTIHLILKPRMSLS